MPEDAEEIVDRLCTIAGMIMEDTLEAALVRRSAGLQTRVAMLVSAGEDIAALGRAAAVVVTRYVPGT